MSGHSHWAQIKHRKTAQDARRAQIYSTVSRMITRVVREGGPRPENNPRLRLAIKKAQEVNMPRRKIDHAIKKGIGALSEETHERIFIDAFGPGGVPLLIEAITDNRNRTFQMVRTLLSRADGKIGGEGTTQWLFAPTVILDLTIRKNRETVLLKCIEHGARDIEEKPSGARLFIDPLHLDSFLSFLKGKLRIRQLSFRHTYLPRQRTTLSPSDALALKNLIRELTEHDEIQEVYAAADSR